MAKILLVMLYADAPVEWWNYFKGTGAPARLFNMKLERKSSMYFYPFAYVVTRSERNSFDRTLKIMRESGLITLDEPYGDHTLTEKGKTLAIKFDKEMRKSVEDFSLVSKIAEELKQKRAQEESK